MTKAERNRMRAGARRAARLASQAGKVETRLRAAAAAADRLYQSIQKAHEASGELPGALSLRRVRDAGKNARAQAMAALREIRKVRTAAIAARYSV